MLQKAQEAGHPLGASFILIVARWLFANQNCNVMMVFLFVPAYGALHAWRKRGHFGVKSSEGCMRCARSAMPPRIPFSVATSENETQIVIL